MIYGGKITAMLPRFCEKSFNSGVFKPGKMRFGNKCNDKTLCDECDNQVNEKKEFQANLGLLK